MNEQRKINYLVTWLSIAFIVICIIAYYFTNDKTEWYFKLLNNLIPEILGPIAALLFIFYAFTKRGINVFEPERSENHPNSTFSLASMKPDSFGIKLTSHSDNCSVNRETILSGTYKFMPSNTKINIYRLNSSQTQSWVSTMPLILDKISQTWQSKIYIGGINDTNKVFYLVIVLEDIATEPWIAYYKKISEELNDWRALTYPLPNSVVEIIKIKVTRL